MIRIFCCFISFLLWASPCKASNAEITISTELSAPLISLTKRYPIEISSENKNRFQESSEIERQEEIRITESLKAKILPWPQLIALFCFIFVCFFAQFIPAKRIKEQGQGIKTASKRTLRTLKSLEKGLASQTNSPNFYYNTIVDTLRSYIEENYGAKILSRTSPELIVIIEKNTSFNQETKKKLIELFERGELIKFAKQIPSFDECLYAHQKAVAFLLTEQKNHDR